MKSWGPSCSLKTQPRATRGSSGFKGAYPGNMGSFWALEAYLGSMEAHPGIVEAHLLILWPSLLTLEP